MQTGIYAGATVAPFGFSALSAATGFTGAALLTSVAGVLAAGLVLLGHNSDRFRSPARVAAAGRLFVEER